MENFETIVERIVKKDPRYPFAAYHFIKEALEYTIKTLYPENTLGGHSQNIPGSEFLNGIRKFALLQYGPLTLTVLNHWNIQATEDFGYIIFNLVESGVLMKSKDDRLEDFKNYFDFYEAFQKPFLPESAPEK